MIYAGPLKVSFWHKKLSPNWTSEGFYSFQPDVRVHTKKSEC